MSKEFKLHYHCRNNGDGSVSVQFHKNEEEAEKADEAMDEGWGESSASYVNLKIVKGIILFSDYDEVNGKYQKVWKPLEEL